MDRDSELEQEIIARLRQEIADAEQRGYERGVRETMDKIQNLVMNGAGVSTLGAERERGAVADDVDANKADDSAPTTQERKRAPKGLVRKVVTRALKATPGMTPEEIEATAQDDLERMIRAASYRSELRKGREAGLYREDDGKWFLVEGVKAEDSLSSTPSAFGVVTERG